MKLLQMAVLAVTLVGFTSCAHHGGHHAEKSCCSKDSKSCEMKDKKCCKDGKSCDMKKKKEVKKS